MLIRGDLVHCPHLGDLAILHDYLLVVNENGFLDHVAPAASQESFAILQREPQETCLRLPRGSFLVPTFCDLHLHAPQFLYQGTGLHLPLMEWLDEYAFKAEERIDADNQLAERVYRRLAERLIESGTGAVVLFGTIDEETNLILAKAMLAAGIRAYVGKLSMDISSRPTYVEASADAALASTASFADRCIALQDDIRPPRRLVEPILTPRFVPTCSDNLLQGLGQLSKGRNLRVQSHMAEAHDQVQWVRRERGIDDMAVFERSGLLTSRTIQAHCTFLDTPSLSHVFQRGTSIAHCPLSNAYFSAEPFHLREALDLGVKVGLGTDIAGGYSIDMMSCMRQAVAVSRMREGSRVLKLSSSAEGAQHEPGAEEAKVLSIDWKEALYLATAGGAIAMGLAPGIGTFTVGTPFDAQQIRLLDETSWAGVGALDFFDEVGSDNSWTLSLEHIEKWWCLGDTRNREGVWVQGRKIWPAS